MLYTCKKKFGRLVILGRYSQIFESKLQAVGMCMCAYKLWLFLKHSSYQRLQCQIKTASLYYLSDYQIKLSPLMWRYNLQMYMYKNTYK